MSYENECCVGSLNGSWCRFNLSVDESINLSLSRLYKALEKSSEVVKKVNISKIASIQDYEQRKRLMMLLNQYNLPAQTRVIDRLIVNITAKKGETKP